MKIQLVIESQVKLVYPAKFFPERCRVILVDQSVTKIVGILRQKPKKEPYVVLPGGGVETTDGNPLVAIRRELMEELSLDEFQYDVAEKGIFVEDQYGRQFYFLAEMREMVDVFTLGGPEAKRNIEISGTYLPQWFLLSDIEKVNLVPTNIKMILLKAAS
jgi:8-oxo-dGTP pyrophosphatase MutT (NUDIX family)